MSSPSVFPLTHLPPLTRSEIFDNAALARYAQRLVDLGFFRTIDQARGFLSKLQSRCADAMQLAPDNASAIDEAAREFLARSWDVIHSAFDPVSGRATPGARDALAGNVGPLREAVALTGAATLPPISRDEVPEQLYQLALRRVESGEFKTYSEALRSVCDEFHTPMPQVAAVVRDLVAAEPALLHEEAEAQARLDDARRRIMEIRAAAVGVITTRDRLESELSGARAAHVELTATRQLVARRRDRAATLTQKYLRSQTKPWDLMASNAAAVVGFDFCLVELDRKIAEASIAVASAEGALSDFQKTNAAGLALVSTT